MRVLILGLAVTALISLVTPIASAQQANDEAMAHQIAENLKNSGQMKGYKVGVAFREGTAWLNGRVSDAEQASQAEQVARSTPGVSQVINNLTVEENTAEPNRLLSALSGIKGKAFAARRPAVKPAVHMASPAANQYVRPVAHNEYQGQTQGQRQGQSQVGTPFYAPPAPQIGQQQGQGQIIQTAAAQPIQRTARRTNNMPRAHARAAGYGRPIPSNVPGGHPARPATYDNPNMPGYAWPSYAASPNYAGLTYPKQYSPTAWPFIGPFYPYPQVPLGWRKVTLEWDDGWWMLDFKEH